jgi:peptidoglycan hydrolase CwlO-like protein
MENTMSNIRAGQEEMNDIQEKMNDIQDKISADISAIRSGNKSLKRK